MSPDTPIQSLGSLISSFYEAALAAVGLCVFGMFIYAGYKFMFGKSGEGWTIIQDAIIGTIILFSAVAILNTISPDLTEQRGAELKQLK